MIARLAATAAAVVPVAAHAVAADTGATAATSEPVIWHVAGYAFEAGSMIAALCACIAVRFWVVQQEAKPVWRVEGPILALVLLFTAGVVARERPDPLFALLWGTGLGVLGAGIITIAKQWVDRGLTALVGATPPEPPTPPAV